MTAAELFEVVKDVPREAWPKLLDWDGQWFEDKSVGIYPSLEIIEHAFIGSMTAWLMRRNVFASKSQFEETYWTISFDMNNLNHRLGNYKSLVAALAAACKEAE